MDRLKIYGNRMLIMVITALVFTGLFSAGLFRFFPTLAHELGHCIFGGGGWIEFVSLDGNHGMSHAFGVFGFDAVAIGGVLGGMLVGGLVMMIRQGFWKGFGLAIVIYLANQGWQGDTGGAGQDMSHQGIRGMVFDGIPVMFVIAAVLFVVGIVLNIRKENKMKLAGKKTWHQMIIDYSDKQQKKKTDEIMKYAKMYLLQNPTK